MLRLRPGWFVTAEALSEAECEERTTVGADGKVRATAESLPKESNGGPLGLAQTPAQSTFAAKKTPLIFSQAHLARLSKVLQSA